jgi:hypothetical protein
LDDNKICADIEQLRFTREFSFLDEFFNQGSSMASAECAGGGVECFLTNPEDGLVVPCGGAEGGKAWRVVNTVLRQLTAAANDAFSIIDASCPDDAFSKAAGCAAAESIAFVIYAVLRVVSCILVEWGVT